MANFWMVVFLLFCSLVVSNPADINSKILQLYKETYYGDGTYYGSGGNVGGLCQYYPPGLPPAGKMPGMRSVAINTPQLFNSISCGMCFKVHGTGDGLGATPIVGISYAFVDNECPGCLKGDLDFAEDGDGRWHIGIQGVQCPVGDTNIEYKFQGSNPWYIKLQTRNHRVPITQLELFQKKLGTFTPLKHTRDGFWELDPTESWEKPLDVPLVIKMTSANGVVLEDSIAFLVNAVVIPGNVQVPFDPNLPYMNLTNNAKTTTTTKEPPTSKSQKPKTPTPKTASPEPKITAKPPTPKPSPTTTPTTNLMTMKTKPTSVPDPRFGILDLYRKRHTGFGTYSNTGPKAGTLCQYAPPDLPPVAGSTLIRTTAGLGRDLMQGSLACGTCFKAQATGEGAGTTPLKGEFYVFVDNVCSGCPGGSLNLAEHGDGRWNLTIQAVQCPVGETKIGYKFQGSNEWYIKLQIRNQRIPITEVKLRQKAEKKWTPLKPTNDGFWEMDPKEQWHRPLAVPMKIRMKSANGAIMKDVIQKIENDVVLPGKVQVPFDPNLPSMPSGSDVKTSPKASKCRGLPRGPERRKCRAEQRRSQRLKQHS